MPLRDTKLSTLHRLGLAALAMLLLMLGAATLWRTALISAEFDLLSQDRHAMMLANQVQAEVNEVSRMVPMLFTATDPGELAARHGTISASDAAVSVRLAELAKSLDRDPGQTRLAAVLAARDAYCDRRDRLLRLLRTGSTEDARVNMLQQTGPAQTAYLQRLDELVRLQDEQMAESGRILAAKLARTEAVLAALLAVLMALAAGLALPFRRSTTASPEPLARNVPTPVCPGEARTSNAVPIHRDTDALAATLQDMRMRLAAMVGEASSNADAVAMASSQIAHGNQVLDQRSAELARALRQAAVAMDALGPTLHTGGERARSAHPPEVKKAGGVMATKSAHNLSTRSGPAVRDSSARADAGRPDERVSQSA